MFQYCHVGEAMLKAFKTVNGKLKEVTLEEAKKDLASRQRICFWIDATTPTVGELDELSKMFGIPVEDLNACLDEEERPRVEQTESYSLVIYRAPHIHKETKKKKEEIEILTSPIGIFMTKDSIITVHLHHTRYLEDFVERSVPIEDVSSFLYKIIAQITSRYFRIIDKLDEDIENLEEEIFASPGKKTVEKLFDTRKALLFFHKSLTADREVLTTIEKGYVPQIDKKNREKFRDLYTETIQLIDMAATYRELLTSALDIYISSISNNLNTVMKTLTVLTALLMVPTLIAGIYGMNIGLPLADLSVGFGAVLIIMIISMFITFMFFKRKGWV